MVRYSWGWVVCVDDRPDLARLGRVPARHPRRRRRRIILSAVDLALTIFVEKHPL